MADEKPPDPQTGISLRFIRQYDIAADRTPRMTDVALELALADERDLPFAQKLADAHAFVKSRIH